MLKVDTYWLLISSLVQRHTIHQTSATADTVYGPISPNQGISEQITNRVLSMSFASFLQERKHAILVSLFKEMQQFERLRSRITKCCHACQVISSLSHVHAFFLKNDLRQRFCSVIEKRFMILFAKKNQGLLRKDRSICTRKHLHVIGPLRIGFSQLTQDSVRSVAGTRATTIITISVTHIISIG